MEQALRINGLRYGKYPDFDKQVALRMLAFLAHAGESKSLSLIVADLNSDPGLTSRLPERMMNIFPVYSGHTGYALTLLEALQKIDAIAITPSEKRGMFGTSKTLYSITDSGREVTEDTLTLPAAAKRKAVEHP